MLKDYNKYKIMKVFFNDPVPEGGFGLREISRKIPLSPLSVKLYLNQLESEGFIFKKMIHGRPVYYAKRDYIRYKLYRKTDIVIEINESGLLDYIYDSLLPEVVILFGSASRGEDVKESDIDLFIIGKERKLELEKYEKYLNRIINLYYSSNFTKLSNELKNNIINGIVLKGYLKAYGIAENYSGQGKSKVNPKDGGNH